MIAAEANRVAHAHRGPAASGEPGGVLPAGFRLDRYRILRPLAAGGFGITYLATHDALDKRYAIKEHFPREFASREGSSVRPNTADADLYRWALTRFVEEARKLARFKHRAIVDVTDVFEANGTAYMVMAFEDGASLGGWLERLKRPPAQAELDAILAPLLDALELVHVSNFLHRDIAPDNIIVRPDGSPCLIDFGAARQAMGQQSKSLTAIVKAGYSPVEQYDTEGTAAQGPWTDIYALAATLYRAVTGAKPQEGPARTLGDRLVAAAALARGPYRAPFLAAIDAGLRVAPAERPPSVAAWRPMLLGPAAASPDPATVTIAPTVPGAQHALSVEPPPPHSPPPAPVAVSPAVPRRRSGRATGAAILGAGALMLAGAWYFAGPDAEQAAERAFAKIASATEATVFDDLAKRYPNTKAGKRAQARATELHLAAARSEWARIKAGDDEAALELFIARHGDLQIAADARARLAEVRRAKQARAQRIADAAAEWAGIRESGDDAAMERFLARYGDLPIAVDARNRLAEVRRAKQAEADTRAHNDAAAAAWERLKAGADIAAIDTFLLTYGNTPVAAEARQRRAVLQASSITRQPTTTASEDCRQNADVERRIRGCTVELASDPDNADALRNRGIAHYRKGDHDRAIADFDHLLRLRPDDAVAYRGRGLAYGQKRDHDRAIRDLSQAIRLDPQNAALYTDRAVTYNNKEFYTLAIWDADEAIRLNASSAHAFNVRGIAHARLKDNQRALADFDSAIRIEPNYSAALANRGIVHEALGNRAQAIADFQKALAINKDDQAARNGLRRLGVNL